MGGGQWEEPLSELRARGLPYGEGWWGGQWKEPLSELRARGLPYGEGWWGGTMEGTPL